MEILLIILTASFFFSCKLTRGNLSSVKHEFGETRLEPEVSFIKCLPPESPRFSVQDQYLHDLMFYIIDKNPNTFQAPYSRDRFCIYTVEDEKINALANFEESKVTINSGIMEKAPSDAALAWLISHEMSHLLGSIFNQTHPKLRENEEFIAWRAKVREKRKELTDYKAQNDLINEEHKMIIEQKQKEILSRLPEDIRKERIAILRELQKLKAMLYDSIQPENPELRKLQLNLFYKITNLFDNKIKKSIYWQDFAQYEYELSDTEKKLSFADLKDDFKNEVETIEKQVLVFEDKISSYYRNIGEEINKNKRYLERYYHRCEILEDSCHYAELAVDSAAQQILGDEEYYNWSEKRADEVGLELYLRAGFSMTEAEWFLKENLGVDGVAACMAKIESAKENSSVIERGTDSHPELCWRIYNLEVLEIENHKNDYQDFLKNPGLVDVFPGRLSFVQENLSKILGK